MNAPCLHQDKPNALDTGLHQRLTNFNRWRLSPSVVAQGWEHRLAEEHEFLLEEGQFVEAERRRVVARAALAPREAPAFIRWFEDLQHVGPGQGDPLFPWLAEQASLDHMRWFLSQEVAGEAGFDDLVALSQVKAPIQAKLELARNYWDEVGRGDARAMHGILLHRLVVELGLASSLEATVTEALALGNLMIALAANRRYAYHSLGALGIIEQTAPGRVTLVDQGLRRLGISPRSRRYFTLHASVDIRHSEAWNREVLLPLVAADPELAQPIAEGALLRLEAGARCFTRYRSVLASMPRTGGAAAPKDHASSFADDACLDHAVP